MIILKSRNVSRLALDLSLELCSWVLSWSLTFIYLFYLKLKIFRVTCTICAASPSKITAFRSFLIFLFRLQSFYQNLRSLFKEVWNHLLTLSSTVIFPKRNMLAKLINWDDFSLIKNFSFHVDFIVDVNNESNICTEREDVLGRSIVSICEPEIMNGYVFHL